MSVVRAKFSKIMFVNLLVTFKSLRGKYKTYFDVLQSSCGCKVTSKNVSSTQMSVSGPLVYKCQLKIRMYTYI